MKAQLPALNMLMVIAVSAASREHPPSRLDAAHKYHQPWGIVWVVISGIFPAAYQRFAVEPKRSRA